MERRVDKEEEQEWSPGSPLSKEKKSTKATDINNGELSVALRSMILAEWWEQIPDCN